MIKQERTAGKGGVGEFGFKETLKTFFCSQNSRNSDSPFLLYKYDLHVNSA